MNDSIWEIEVSRKIMKLLPIEIKQLLLAYKRGNCPCDKCWRCKINDIIMCDRDKLNTDDITNRCQKVVVMIPPEILFDVVL